MEPSRPAHPGWLSGLAVAAFLGSLLPLGQWYVRRASDGSDEPLGLYALLAAVIALALATHYGRKRRQDVRIRPRRMLIAATVLATLQLTGLIPYPLVVGLMAIGLLAWSIHLPRGKAGIIALLVLSLPLMASLDFYAGYPLRWAAANLTTAFLQLVGIAVERQGVMLIDGERLVGIDPPCAGIRMLWTSCFVAAVVAARMSLSGRRTLALLALAVACVVVGNGLRAALVFFPESGRVRWPEAAHAGVGLLVHAAVLATLFQLASRLGRSPRPRVACAPKLRPVITVAGGLLMVFISLQATAREDRASPSPASHPWPSVLEGKALVPLPLSPVESRFAAAFPGTLARFAWSDAEVILRRTDRPTRMMHPSTDCLRAAGFEIHREPVFRDADQRLWGRATALKAGRRWQVRERYESSDGSASTDASAWYWAALMRPDEGPWLATTVIEPAP